MSSQPLRFAHAPRLPSVRAATLFTLTPLALCLAQAAMAQQPSTPAADAAVTAPQLQEVRINASTEKDMGFAPVEAQTTNVQQALQTVAGVSPVNFGRRGFDDLNIRGFRPTESILVDGLVQSPGMWAKLQPYGYERFEVLEGSASVLYGQVQPGGIVNAVSKRPKKEAINEVGVEVGSFGQRTLQADVNKPLSESGKTALRINAQVSNADDPTQFVYRKDRWFAPSLSI